MPKIIVKIEWDVPDDKNWLNPYNIALALHSHCKNSRFLVSDVGKRISTALLELGVPNEGYPAVVDNAVRILKELEGLGTE